MFYLPPCAGLLVGRATALRITRSESSASISTKRGTWSTPRAGGLAPARRTSAGVTIGGHALLAWDNGTQGRAVWTDSRGHLLGGTFALPFRIDKDSSVAPLLDGTLAFRQGDDWTFVLGPKSRTPTAAPSWLSSRPGSVLFLARGGRAHALVTQPPPGSCQAHVVLFAPAGNRCGAIDLPSAAADGCNLAAEIGQDGTVTVLGRTDRTDSEGLFSEWFYARILQ
jgi:hypothetical protein